MTPTVTTTESRLDLDELRHAHDALLRRTLAYVGGALAAFFPLLEFILLSHQDERLLLWPPLALFLVLVGTIISAILTGAALGSFLEVLVLEGNDSLNPDRVVLELHPSSKVVAWYANLLRSLRGDSLASYGAVAIWIVVLALLVSLDMSLLSL